MLIEKIRSHGLKWFFRRIVRELQIPTRPWTRRMIDAVVGVKRRLLGPRRLATPHLRAVYDLEVGANTFDFAYFLVSAEMEAVRRNLPGYEVVLLPKYRGDLRENEYATIVDDAAQEWRIQALLLPLAQMSGPCRGIFLARARELGVDYLSGAAVYPELYGQASLRGLDYPEFYSRSRHTDFEGLRPSTHALRAVGRWLQSRGVSRPAVVITLRGYGHDPARDSALAEWRQLSHHLAERGFEPIVVPDAELAADQPPLEGFSGKVCLEVCWNLDLRMALYETAYLGLFVNNGPAHLAALNRRCRYIIFKMATRDSSLANLDYLRRMGLEPGKPFPFARPAQWVVWEDDSLDVMTRQVDAFVAQHPPERR